MKRGEMLARPGEGESNTKKEVNKFLLEKFQDGS
jgi:hypothetical protein